MLISLQIYFMSYKLFHVPNSTDTEYSLDFISILKGLKTDEARVGL